MSQNGSGSARIADDGMLEARRRSQVLVEIARRAVDVHDARLRSSADAAGCCGAGQASAVGDLQVDVFGHGR